MRRHVLSTAIVFALSQSAFAQSALAQSTTTTSATLPLSYVGSNQQINVGINQDGDLSGGATFVFGQTGRSNWLGQAWLGQAGAGGLQLDYHWLWNGMSLDDAIADPDKATVGKAFLAVDQNAFDDRKLTLGMGWEREHWFVDAYISQGLTDERLVDSNTDVFSRVLTGNLGGRPFRQTQTTTTVTDTFEKAYEDGVGVRLGRFFDEHLLRIRGGFDYEDGEFGASQETVSLGMEKFFQGSPHSLALDMEFLNKTGRFEIDQNDSRGMLSYRYDFGKNNFRVANPTRDVEVKREVIEQVAGEPQVVKNDIRIDAESFFHLDSARITEQALTALDEVIGTINSPKRVSRVNVTGHTCDLGSESYNQALSERRANAVRDFFAARGIAVAELDVAGKGESEPKYPNDRDNRGKNRRVDISFLTIEEKTIAATPTEVKKEVVEWVKEPIKVAPAWIERALRNPAAHKRTVDVYRFEKATIDTELGPIEFINRAPVAVDDAITGNVNGSPITILPLSNDSDPDGDLLSPVSLTQPANGTATFAVGALVNYIPRPGFVGTDSFTYTITDGKGGNATATIRVTVQNAAPVAVDDAATTALNTAVSVNVLGNDSDAENQALNLVSVGTAAHGMTTIIGNQVRYTPNNNYSGADEFTYTVSDPNGATATARVRITVLAGPVNRAPIAVDDSRVIYFARDISLLVMQNDSDPDGDAIRVVSNTQPANGVLSITPDGFAQYRANVGWCGVDTFTYTIEDVNGARSTATVSIETID